MSNNVAFEKIVLFQTRAYDGVLLNNESINETRFPFIAFQIYKFSSRTFCEGKRLILRRCVFEYSSRTFVQGE